MSDDDIVNNPELNLEKDISLAELSKNGFMVGPISNRNREYL